MSISERPSSTRHVILGLTVLVAVLLYLDRYCLSFVIGYIRDDYRLTDVQRTDLLGAFFVTYAVGQIPCGWLSDRFGTRLMLGTYLAIWSTLTGLMGFAQGYIMLLWLRFGCGLFEAGAYPACAGLIRRWIPYEQRGLASGIVSIGGRLGGTITPLLTAYLMVVFMPVSSSSLVAKRDFLKPGKFARDVLLLPATNEFLPLVPQIAPRLQARLAPQALQTFKEIASLPDGAEPTDAQFAVLTGAVNEFLKQPDLTAGIDLQPIEAKLDKQALVLFEQTGESRGVDEITRRNRFLLEVLFPDSIRKLYGDSWQPVLKIYGTIGVLVALFFWGFYRNTPREHFLSNEAEAELIEAHETKADAAPTASLRAVAYGILSSPGLWACAVVQFGTNFVWSFLANEMPTYLQRVYQVPVETRGWMTFWPFFVSLPMLILGGWWTDGMTKKYGPRLGRFLPLASTRFVGAAAMFTCCFLDAPWLIVIAFCIFSMASDLGLAAIWAYNLDVGGRNVGLILGWGNMIGNLGAAVSATAFGFILKQYVNVDATTYSLADLKRGYGAVFLTCSAVFVFIGILSFFIDATKAIGIPQTTPPSEGEKA